MFPHPFVRLLLLILLAAVLPALGLAGLALVFAAILVTCRFSAAGDWRRLLGAVRRLRWLLASLFVVHLGFADDRFAILGGSIWLPAPAAVELACERAGLLVVLLAAVELMRQTTPAETLAASLVRLLAPLRAAGADTRRFALRLAMTMEAVPESGRRLADYARERGIRTRGLSAWAHAAADLVRATEQRAADDEPGGAKLPELKAPAGRDWMAFGGAAAALLALSAV